MQKRSIALITCASAIALMVASTPAALQTFAQGNTPATLSATMAVTRAATLSPTMVATSSAAVTNAKFAGLLDGAAYFAADSPFYASIRLDSAFLGNADAVLSKIEKGLPANILPASSQLNLTQILDLFSQLTLQQKLSDVQKWLGSSVSFGVNTLNTFTPDFSNYSSPANAPSYAIVAPVTDQTAAAQAIGTLVAQTPGQWTRQTVNGSDIVYTSGTASYNQMTILIRKNVLVFGTPAGVAVATSARPISSLAGQSLFTETLALLPASSYNAVFYLDTPAILARSAGRQLSYSGGGRSQTAINLISALVTTRLIGPQVWGATILNNDTLTLDVAQHAGNMAMLAAAGLVQKTGTPVDPKFTALLPANTIAALQIANPLASYDNAITNLGALWDLLPVSVMAPINYSLYAIIDAQPPTNPASGKAAVQRLLRSADVFITGATGLTTKDATALFSGNLEIGLTVNPNYKPSNPYNTSPVDFVLVSELTGTVDGTAMINTLARQLQLTFDAIAPNVTVQVSTSTTLPVPVLVISWQAGYGNTITTQEAVFAVYKNVAVFGSRAPVTGILNQLANPSTTAPALPAFNPLLLQNSSILGYWSPTATLQLINVTSRNPNDSSTSSLKAIVGLFSNATLSSVTDTAGNTIQRFTISLK